MAAWRRHEPQQPVALRLIAFVFGIQEHFAGSRVFPNDFISTSPFRPSFLTNPFPTKSWIAASIASCISAGSADLSFRAISISLPCVDLSVVLIVIRGAYSGRGAYE